MTMRPKIQLVGIGNTDREDDGVGHVVVRSVIAAHPDWQALLVRQLLPEMVNSINASGLLVFVDGAVDLLPGTVVASPVSSSMQTLVSHQLSPGQLMALAEWVMPHHRSSTQCFQDGIQSERDKLPEAWCVRIGIARLGFGRMLSPDVAACVDRAVRAVELICAGQSDGNDSGVRLQTCG